MKALYTQTSIISKLKKAFYEIFSNEGSHTKEHLFEMLLSVLSLNGFQSVKYNFEHFIRHISDNRLKSYYFTLNESKINLSQWMKNMVRTALSLIPETLLKELIILSIDDTMVEKYGEHFENREKLFDHARHNGSNYLYGPLIFYRLPFILCVGILRCLIMNKRNSGLLEPICFEVKSVLKD